MAKRARSEPKRATPKTRRPERPASTSAAPSPTPVARPAFQPAVAPSAQALALFQDAMAALQRHAYRDAAQGFRAVIDRFPGERALLDRTRVYLALCERELQRQPAAPRTVEERLTAATAALNNDDDALAERLVKSVLSEDERHDLALYLMAAVEARRGDAESALAFLSRAVTVSPEVRAQARHDVDFEILRGSEAFQSLIDPPSHPGRRARRR
jgi:tetratricopeptide (TPR) repeat protein